MEIVIFAVLLGLVPAVIANNKGRSFVLWWLFGAALFIVALPMAIIAKPDEGRLIELGERRKCPYCAELISPQATVCRYCGRDLEPYVRTGPIWTPLMGRLDGTPNSSTAQLSAAFGRPEWDVYLELEDLRRKGLVSGDKRAWQLTPAAQGFRPPGNS